MFYTTPAFFYSFIFIVSTKFLFFPIVKSFHLWTTDATPLFHVMNSFVIHQFQWQIRSFKQILTKLYCSARNKPLSWIFYISHCQETDRNTKFPIWNVIFPYKKASKCQHKVDVAKTCLSFTDDLPFEIAFYHIQTCYIFSVFYFLHIFFKEARTNIFFFSSSIVCRPILC